MLGWLVNWKRFGRKTSFNQGTIPPLWSSGQSSWLQIQRSGFHSRRYQIFWQVVGLERDPLGLVRITEELFQGNSGSGLEKPKLTTVGDSLRWPRGTLYRLKLALLSPTSGGRSVGIVRFRTQATEFNYPGIFLEGLKNTTKITSQDSWCPDRGSK
jgi:hypothetical protein